MQIASYLALGALAGLALGAGFYVGLWATVRRASRATRPWAWFAGSFVLRLAAVGFVLVLLARHGPWLLAGALAGLVAARPLVTSLLFEGRERAR